MTNLRSLLTILILYGLMIIGNSSIMRRTLHPDPGCSVWNYQKDVCVKCSHRYEYDQEDQLCKKVDDLCKEWNNKRECTKCYKGYKIESGKCVYGKEDEKKEKEEVEEENVEENESDTEADDGGDSI